MPGNFNTRIPVLVNGIRISDITIDQIRPNELSLSLGPVVVYEQNAIMSVVNVITYNGFGINGTELSSSSSNRGRDMRASQYGEKLGNDTDALVSSSVLRSRGADRFFDDGNSGISGIAYNLSSEDVKRELAR
ncbi:hypothetical protein C8R34_102175 [Nitrosomonas sp. Nm84]|nr:hypothetical protein C8R34_102175 [Nitrosomonas sp. Nm84]